MSHARDRGKREKKKSSKRGKKRKGQPPHSERTKQSDSIREIQRHLDEIREKEK